MSLSRKAFDSRQDNKQKTLDPGLRWDDVLRTVGFKTVIPAQAGIQRR